MANGYTRQSVFIDGDVIRAEHGNSEFDRLVQVFESTQGHNHDGSDNNGGTIPLLRNPQGTFTLELFTDGVRGNIVDTDVNLEASSPSLLPSQNAVKSYVDSNITGLTGIIEGLVNTESALTVVLEDGETFLVPNNISRLRLLTVGDQATINLPTVPGEDAVYTVVLKNNNSTVTLNTTGGLNTHGIFLTDNQVNTCVTLKGPLDFEVYWDGEQYREVDNV